MEYSYRLKQNENSELILLNPKTKKCILEERTKEEEEEKKQTNKVAA